MPAGSAASSTSWRRSVSFLLTQWPMRSTNAGSPRPVEANVQRGPSSTRARGSQSNRHQRSPLTGHVSALGSQRTGACRRSLLMLSTVSSWMPPPVGRWRSRLRQADSYAAVVVCESNPRAASATGRETFAMHTPENSRFLCSGGPAPQRAIVRGAHATFEQFMQSSQLAHFPGHHRGDCVKLA